MIKVKKAICTFLCALILCASVSLYAFVAESDCSLTLVYRGDDNSFEGLEISIYRVGDLSDTVGFTLKEFHPVYLLFSLSFILLDDAAICKTAIVSHCSIK